MTREGDEDQNNAADGNNAIGGGIDMMDYTDTSSRLHDIADSDCDVASGSLEPSDEEGAAELPGCSKTHPGKRPLESSSSSSRQ